MASEGPGGTLSRAAFDALSGLFRQVAGLLFEPHMAYRLEARLLPRLRATGSSSWSEYIALLKSGTREGEAELAAALERVTVHETYFFREKSQLDAFAQELVPAMTTSGGDAKGALCSMRGGVFRVWSAGCSTGEEAWTLAILLEETGCFGASRPLAYEVIGTDLAASVVATARRGRYGPRGFRGDVPDDILDRYFEREGANRVVKGEVRSAVRFFVGNLLDEAHVASLGRFHVVVCRNVLIYMSKDARQRILRQLYERLLPGGVLLLGHSESLLNVETEFRFLALKNELVYVRPKGERSGASLPALSRSSRG